MQPLKKKPLAKSAAAGTTPASILPSENFTTALVPQPRPFLKWAGGKARLLSTFAEYFPSSYNRYFEPFIGGGAVFFHLRPERAIICDLSEELINCYTIVRDDVDSLIKELNKHKNEQEHYYKVREQNPAGLTAAARAARLIFLNKTCFNGLYRVNSKGKFNVPFGKYANPLICDEANLSATSSALTQAQLICQPFEKALAKATKGDFVYLDPPYMPVSPTANFTGYTAGSFSAEDQKKLAKKVTELSKRGCKFMLSNSNADFIADLYKEFRIVTVHATRQINCKAERRGAVRELLIMNY